MTSLVGSETGLDSSARGSGRATVSLWLARLLVLAALLILWQSAVWTGLANPAFVATPISVGQSLWGLLEDGEIFPHLVTTLIEIGIAFFGSAMLGIATAVILDRSDRVNLVISPFLTAFNSMPRIALGPLFILWFGIGIASKVVLALSLGYFIMLLSTLGGLKNVDRDLLLMSRLFGASDFGLFRHVRLPWALPSIFAGLRLTLIYCTAGAVIGEMIAATSGLGLLVQTYSGSFDVPAVMALILVIAFVVMALTSVIDMAERRLLGWSKGSTSVPG